MENITISQAKKIVQLAEQTKYNDAVYLVKVNEQDNRLIADILWENQIKSWMDKDKMTFVITKHFFNSLYDLMQSKQQNANCGYLYTGLGLK